MVMTVEIISKEMIKPSSPTPHHLRNLKLSFLDQLAPPVYVPIILFYQSELGFSIPTDRAQKSHSLKQSLSNVLTQFYPLAGKIGNDNLIDCNDDGAEYIEAEVHSHLSQVIQNPDMEELKQYLPMQPYGNMGMGKDIVLAIQANLFDCGGLALGVCISHKIADGSSLVTFINAWAATCHGATNITNPTFDLAFHFKPRGLSGFTPATGITQGKIVTRRFVFDKMKLDSLKEAASSAVGTQVENPTRVEALSGFIWKQFIEVSKSKLEANKLFLGLHAVNLRHRMSPPLPDNAFGNIWSFSLALLTTEEDTSYHNLVGKLRNSFRKIGGDYVKDLLNGDGYMDNLNRTAEKFCKGEIESCNFSSWCRFPVYEADYGWGKPIWVCTTTLPFKNVVILISTQSGDGIEAWINMAEEDMAMIEHHFY